MSYNSAYREDDNSTMFSKRIAFTQTAINQISEAFPPSLPPPGPTTVVKNTGAREGTRGEREGNTRGTTRRTTSG